jgi:serine/threonine protein kinase
MHGTTDVAIKVVSSPSPRQLKSFVEEIMIWKKCYHPNIISILGANNQAQQILLTMEFMPGGDLYTQMENDVNKRYTWYQR